MAKVFLKRNVKRGARSRKKRYIKTGYGNRLPRWALPRSPRARALVMASNFRELKRRKAYMPRRAAYDPRFFGHANYMN